MKLFQRVQKASIHLTGTKYGLHEDAGVKLPTFKGYFSDKRESNLWPLLPKILAANKRLSRQWLYFEEGPMLMPKGEPIPLRALITIVEEIAKDAGGNYRDLLEYMIGMPREEETASNNANLMNENARLKDQIISLQTELNEARKKTISMYEERSKENTFSSGAETSSVPTGPGAAPLSRGDSE